MFRGGARDTPRKGADGRSVEEELLRALASAKESHEEALLDARAERADLLRRVSELEEFSKSQSEIVLDLQRQNQDLLWTASEAEAEVERIASGDQRALKDALREAHAFLHAMQEAHGGCAAEIDALRAGIAAAESRAADESTALLAAQSIEAARAETAAAAAAAHMLGNQLGVEREELAHMREEAANSRAAFESLNAEVLHLRDLSASMGAELTALRAFAAAASAETAEVSAVASSGIDAARADSARMAQALEACRAEAAQYFAALELTREDAAQLRAALDAARADSTHWGGALDSARSDAAGLRASLDASHADAAGLRAALEASRAQNVQMGAAIEAARADATALRGALDAARADCAQSSSAAFALRRELDDFREAAAVASHAASVAASRDAASAAAAATAELAVVRSAHAEADARATALAKTLQSRDEEILSATMLARRHAVDAGAARGDVDVLRVELVGARATIARLQMLSSRAASEDANLHVSDTSAPPPSTPAPSRQMRALSPSHAGGVLRSPAFAAARAEATAARCKFGFSDAELDKATLQTANAVEAMHSAALSAATAHAHAAEARAVAAEEREALATARAAATTEAAAAAARDLSAAFEARSTAERDASDLAHRLANAERAAHDFSQRLAAAEEACAVAQTHAASLSARAEADAASLTARVDEARSEIAALRGALSSAIIRAEAAEAAIADAEARAARLFNESASSRESAEIASITARAEAAVAEAAAAVEETRASVARAEVAEATVTMVEARAGELQAQLDAARDAAAADASSAEEQLRYAVESAASWQARASELDEKIAALSDEAIRQSAMADAALCTAQQRVAEVEAQRDELDSRVSALESHLEKSATLIDEAEATVRSARIAEAARVEEIKVRLAEHLAEVKRMARADIEKREAERAAERVSEAEGRAAAIEAAVVAAVASAQERAAIEADAAQAVLKAARSSAEHFETAVTDEGAASNARMTLEAVTSAVARVRSEHEIRARRDAAALDAANAKVADAEARLAIVEDQLAALRQSSEAARSAAKEDLSAAVAAAQTAAAEVTHLRAALESARASNASAAAVDFPSSPTASGPLSTHDDARIAMKAVVAGLVEQMDQLGTRLRLSHSQTPATFGGRETFGGSSRFGGLTPAERERVASRLGVGVNALAIPFDSADTSHANGAFAAEAATVRALVAALAEQEAELIAVRTGATSGGGMTGDELGSGGGSVAPSLSIIDGADGSFATATLSMPPPAASGGEALATFAATDLRPTVQVQNSDFPASDSITPRTRLSNQIAEAEAQWLDVVEQNLVLAPGVCNAEAMTAVYTQWLEHCAFALLDTPGLAVMVELAHEDDPPDEIVQRVGHWKSSSIESLRGQIVLLQNHQAAGEVAEAQELWNSLLDGLRDDIRGWYLQPDDSTVEAAPMVVASTAQLTRSALTPSSWAAGVNSAERRRNAAASPGVARARAMSTASRSGDRGQDAFAAGPSRQSPSSYSPADIVAPETVASVDEQLAEILQQYTANQAQITAEYNLYFEECTAAGQARVDALVAHCNNQWEVVTKSYDAARVDLLARREAAEAAEAAARIADAELATSATQASIGSTELSLLAPRALLFNAGDDLRHAPTLSAAASAPAASYSNESIPSGRPGRVLDISSHGFGDAVTGGGALAWSMPEPLDSSAIVPTAAALAQATPFSVHADSAFQAPRAQTGWRSREEFRQYLESYYQDADATERELVMREAYDRWVRGDGRYVPDRIESVSTPSTSLPTPAEPVNDSRIVDPRSRAGSMSSVDSIAESVASVSSRVSAGVGPRRKGARRLDGRQGAAPLITTTTTAAIAQAQAPPLAPDPPLEPAASVKPKRPWDDEPQYFGPDGGVRKTDTAVPASSSSGGIFASFKTAATSLASALGVKPSKAAHLGGNQGRYDEKLGRYVFADDGPEAMAPAAPTAPPITTSAVPSVLPAATTPGPAPAPVFTGGPLGRRSGGKGKAPPTAAFVQPSFFMPGEAGAQASSQPSTASGFAPFSGAPEKNAPSAPPSRYASSAVGGVALETMVVPELAPEQYAKLSLEEQNAYAAAILSGWVASNEITLSN